MDEIDKNSDSNIQMVINEQPSSDHVDEMQNNKEESKAREQQSKQDPNTPETKKDNKEDKDNSNGSQRNIMEERLLSLSVNIPNGTQETLEIRINDDIEDITNKFCLKYNLDNDCKQMLNETIKKNLYNNTDQNKMIAEEDENHYDSQNERQTEKALNNDKLNDEVQRLKKEISQEAKKRLCNKNQPIINPQSEKIVKKNGLTNIPVYERLSKNPINNERKAKCLSSDKEPNTNETPNNKMKEELFQNCSGLIYRKGIKQLEKKEFAIKQDMEDKLNKDRAVASFKTKINSNSKRLVFQFYD